MRLICDARLFLVLHSCIQVFQGEFYLSNLQLFFAATEEPASGIGAFNINLKAFLFQLATFLIVLLILRRWVLPKLVKTIEDRRKTLEESLVQAKKTEEALHSAEAKAGEIISSAREQADRAMIEAQASAKEIIKAGEASASVQGDRIIAEAKEKLEQEKLKLHTELRAELGELVVEATEKVLREKIDAKTDRRLIERSLKELA